jgi:uncharacterized protein
MNIGITGATGFIGMRVVDLALRRGHEVIAFSRSPERGIPGCEMRRFALDAPPDLAGCEAVIHLAGETIAGLWTPAKKRRIRESRVHGTRLVVEAIKASAEPPEVLVCGSGTGLYGDAGDAEIDESHPCGGGFLAGVVQSWEAEAWRAEGCRVVLLRTSLVLGKGNGALGAMAPIFRAGLGGRLGSGRQWMPWIHIEDEAMLALFALENLEVRGPLNACAPWPVRNADFTKALARVLRRPAFLAVPRFALSLLGDFAHELLDSKRVVPASATEHGFRFRFPELGPALKDLLG